MIPSSSAPGGSAERSRFRMVATICIAVAYCVALHLLIVDHTMPSLTLLVISAPWLLAGASAAARAARTKAIAAATTSVVVGLALAFSAWAIWRLGERLGGHVDVLIFAESFVFLLSLMVLFGASLFGDREALVTRLARIARPGGMPPDVERYTRRVTASWTLFFALLALVSTVLFTTQSRDAWSAFVNLALWPLTAAGFAIEYLIRIRVLPVSEHVSPLAGMRAFMQRDDR